MYICADIRFCIFWSHCSNHVEKFQDYLSQSGECIGEEQALHTNIYICTCLTVSECFLVKHFYNYVKASLSVGMSGT